MRAMSVLQAAVLFSLGFCVLGTLQVVIRQIQIIQLLYEFGCVCVHNARIFAFACCRLTYFI